MESNEFRIGNLINFNGKEIEVRSIFDKGIHDQDFNGIGYDEIEPILISEAFLIKVGFKEDEFGNFENDSRLILFKIEGYDFYTVQWGSSVCGGKTIFIHELQNLYFALTGTELTYENKS